jgi:predicted enzyme related to lactoylglutathione lyase
VSAHPRLHGVVIDVPRADHESAVAFWSAALGRQPQTSENHPDYAQMEEAAPGCYVLVQATGDAVPRIHLDFATEDRDAELDRLAGIGAEEVTREHKWAVMRDPAGQPFCLCPVSGCVE